MGINFGRIAQGLATGYLGAAIKDKESKDNARLEVVKAAGIDYYTNQLPAHKKSEENRASAYKQLTTILGSEEAVDFLDANGILVGDGKDVERVQKMLEDKNIKPDAFKDYVPTSNYSDRYKQRQTDFESRFDVVKKTFDMQGSGIGPSTVNGLLTKPEGAMTTTEEVTTPAVPEKQIEGTPLMTRAIPETTEEVTTTLPRTTADTAMSEFFIPKGVTSNLGKESDIAAAVSTVGNRNFSKGININPETGAVSMTFGNVKNTEYSAIKAVMNDLAPSYTQEDGKTNLSAVTEAADRQLYNQTQGFTSQLFEGDSFKPTETTEGITGSTAGNFKLDFIQEYSTPLEMQKFFVSHMTKLGTKSEQRYFALSFPANVVYPGTTTNIRATLLTAVQ
jgi:hypothetical protein